MPESRPKPPSGLASPGRSLWIRMVGDLPEGFEFDARELAILAAASRQADAIAALEQSIRRDGHIVRGAAGQPRLNGAVTEARQARIALARLLGDLDIPAEAEKSQTASSQRARRAADVRWAEHRARKAAAHG